MYVVIPLFIIIKENVTFIFFKTMPKTTKKYDTCSENNTFLPFCPRPNMWEKS